MEEMHNQSCMWLRTNGFSDPKYQIDLNRFMCSECSNGNETCCNRANEAVGLILKSQKKRVPAKRVRHSYDASHVHCNGKRKEAMQKGKQDGAFKDCTNIPLHSSRKNAQFVEQLHHPNLVQSIRETLLTMWPKK